MKPKPSRILQTTKKKSVKPAAPKDHNEWIKLLRMTIERASKTKDRRLLGLRQAMTDGQAEQILRRMGILSIVDINREMPLPQGT